MKFGQALDALWQHEGFFDTWVMRRRLWADACHGWMDVEDDDNWRLYWSLNGRPCRFSRKDYLADDWDVVHLG